VTAYTGAAAQLVGLGWDAVLHRLDPELAAREGVFTLTNPGHVLFAGGLALVVAGIGMMLIGGGRAGRVARFGLASVLAVLSAGALALAATGEGGLSGGHSHAETIHVHEDGTEHTHEQHEAFLQTQDQSGDAQAADGHSHGQTTTFGQFGDAGQSRHQHAPDIAVSFGDLQTLQEQIATARAATEKYQDVREALKDGYVQVTQDLPLIASHFINARYAIDGIFDPAKPEILLYAKLDGRWTLVGLSYSMPFQDTETAPPDGFAGPLDAWHYHTDLCFSGQRVISATMTAEQCRQAGGRFARNTGWMAHLWLYLESPEGLFAHQNSLLKGSGAVLTRAELAAMQ
jgi:hypothetical protein